MSAIIQLSCNGCGNLSFRLFQYCDAGDWPHIEIYPECSEYDYHTKNPRALPWELRGIYEETVKALNSDLRVLCAIGIRAIIEAICKKQGVNKGYNWDTSKDDYRKDKNGNYRKFKNLEGKIFELYEQGIITKAQSETLHQLRFLGNAAAHELDKPLKSNLKVAMAIVDNIIENLYVIPKYKEKLVKRK